MNNYKKSNNGFTLIEIMVTVAIVGIFASIALPSFAKLIENNRISTATNQLVSALVLTRSEALKRSNDVTICASSTQDSCSTSGDFSEGWVVYQDCDGNGAITTSSVDCDGDAISNEREIIKVSEGFESLYINNPSPSITYLFSGRVQASTFDIGKDATDLKKKVSLSRLGRVKTETLP